jgi:addiction module HigA family antidote
MTNRGLFSDEMPGTLLKLKYWITIKLFFKARLNNIHPGEILLEIFFIPMEISVNNLSKDTDIPQTRISQILKGSRRIIADISATLQNSGLVCKTTMI